MRKVFCTANLPHGGLGSRLFAWANSVVFSYKNNIPLLSPRWYQLKTIGPFLRKEEDKRMYFNLFNKKNAILSVLGGVLGGGMSSRLFIKLREEMGVGYYVRAYNDSFTDHGFFQISAGVDNKRIYEVLRAVLEECTKLKNEKY